MAPRLPQCTSFSQISEADPAVVATWQRYLKRRNRRDENSLADRYLSIARMGVEPDDKPIFKHRVPMRIGQMPPAQLAVSA
jgi:hypothetical protein